VSQVDSKKAKAAAEGEGDLLVSQKVFMGGSGDGDLHVVAATRLFLAKMLGQLAAYIVQPLQPGYVCR